MNWSCFVYKHYTLRLPSIALPTLLHVARNVRIFVILGFGRNLNQGQKSNSTPFPVGLTCSITIFSNIIYSFLISSGRRLPYIYKTKNEMKDHVYNYYEHKHVTTMECKESTPIFTEQNL